jgi:hypothetical protein
MARLSNEKREYELKDKSLIGINENKINANIYEQGEKLFRKFSRMK